MGLVSVGLEIGTFCDFPYSVLLTSAVFGLYFLGRALFGRSFPDLDTSTWRNGRGGLWLSLGWIAAICAARATAVVMGCRWQRRGNTAAGRRP